MISGNVKLHNILLSIFIMKPYLAYIFWVMFENCGKTAKVAKEKQDLQKELEVLVSRLNWVLAKSNGVRLELPKDQKPCYFNTGCCCFPDGDITGFEIKKRKNQIGALAG